MTRERAVCINRQFRVRVGALSMRVMRYERVRHRDVPQFNKHGFEKGSHINYYKRAENLIHVVSSEGRDPRSLLYVFLRDLHQKVAIAGCLKVDVICIFIDSPTQPLTTGENNKHRQRETGV